MGEKIDEFLFDIMGLMFPGAIAVFLITSTIYYNNPTIAVLTEFQNFVKGDGMMEFIGLSRVAIIVVFLSFCYLLGHAIKVFFKIALRFIRVTI